MVLSLLFWEKSMSICVLVVFHMVPTVLAVDYAPVFRHIHIQGGGKEVIKSSMNNQ